MLNRGRDAKRHYMLSVYVLMSTSWVELMLVAMRRRNLAISFLTILLGVHPVASCDSKSPSRTETDSRSTLYEFFTGDYGSAVRLLQRFLHFPRSSAYSGRRAFRQLAANLERPDNGSLSEARVGPEDPLRLITLYWGVPR